MISSYWGLRVGLIYIEDTGVTVLPVIFTKYDLETLVDSEGNKERIYNRETRFNKALFKFNVALKYININILFFQFWIDRSNYAVVTKLQKRSNSL